jgi:hypothetical protein
MRKGIVIVKSHEPQRRDHDGKYLSHLSLLRRHGPQLIAFLARLADALTTSAAEEASRDAGVLGRGVVEGVSEEVERLLAVCV